MVFLPTESVEDYKNEVAERWTI